MAVVNPSPAPEKPLLDAALSYVRRGWYVLPLHWITPRGCSCLAGDACKTPGKHPRVQNGEKNASGKVEQVQAWWQQWPIANIGILTGPKSGIVVLDIDPRHGGDETLFALEKEHGQLPATIEAITGGTGRHILLQHPGRPVATKVGIWPGIDIKGDTGYIVASPSMHISGARYEWDGALHPDDTPLAEMPLWLRWKARTTLEVSDDRSEEIEPEIVDGKRNNVLTSLAGSMRRRGMVREEIEAALLIVNERRCKPSLDVDEVRKLAKSVMRYAPQDVPTGDLPNDPLPDSAPVGEVIFSDAIETGTELVARYVADPEPQWLVKDFIPAIGMTLLSGRPKRGKTLLAEHLAVEVARGGVWLGKAVEQGTAVIIQADQGWRTTARRLQHWGVDDLPIYVLASRGISLARIGKLEEGLTVLKPRIVILDAAAVLLNVRSEFDNQEVAVACARVTALCERLNCAFLLVHHNRKAESAEDALVSVRGGTAWSGAADSILELHSGENGAVQLRATLRDADSPEALTIELDKPSLTFTLLGTTSEVRQANRVEQMLRALEQDTAGQTVVELSARLQWRHEDTARTLRALESDGKARAEKQAKGSKGGRPAEIWTAVVSVSSPTPSNPSGNKPPTEGEPW